MDQIHSIDIPHYDPLGSDKVAEEIRVEINLPVVLDLTQVTLALSKANSIL